MGTCVLDRIEVAMPDCHWLHDKVIQSDVEMLEIVRQCLIKCCICPSLWIVAQWTNPPPAISVGANSRAYAVFQENPHLAMIAGMDWLAAFFKEV
jgi:hypothetical protein